MRRFTNRDLDMVQGLRQGMFTNSLHSLTLFVFLPAMARPFALSPDALFGVFDSEVQRSSKCRVALQADESFRCLLEVVKCNLEQ